MLARLCAFVLWALVAATAVFWGLRLLVQSASAPPAAVVVSDSASPRVDLSRLLGVAPAAPVAPVAQVDANARFRLLGIMAPKLAAAGPAHGVALIAVDGKLPKAFRVGATVDGETLLQSVSLRSAALGSARGGPGFTLELPPLPGVATGTLPAALSGQGAGQGAGQGQAPVPGLAQRIANQMSPAQTAPSPSFAVPQIPISPTALTPQPPQPREPREPREPGAATQ